MPPAASASFSKTMPSIPRPPPPGCCSASRWCSRQVQRSPRYLSRVCATAWRRNGHRPARFRVGECSFFLGDDKSATRETDEFLQRHPGHDLVPLARLYRGQSQLRLNDAAGAEQTLVALIEKNPESGVLAEAHMRRQRRRPGKVRGSVGPVRTVGCGERRAFRGRCALPAGIDRLCF